MQPWVKSVLLVIAAMALVGVVGIAFTPLARRAPVKATQVTAAADEVLSAVSPRVGEIATATAAPADGKLVTGYFEARVLAAADSRPDWKIAKWGAHVRPEQLSIKANGSATPAQRWVIFHFADGSALRVAEIPSAVGSKPSAWRVKSAAVTRP